MVVETTEYSSEEVLEKLKEYCNRFQTKAEAANALGVGRVFLWKVLDGKSPPTEPMLKRIGFTRERKITYTYTKVSDA